MADRRGALIPLLIIAWIIFSPDVNRIPPAHSDERPSIDDVIDNEQRFLSLVQASTWDPSFGSEEHTLNITGLEAERGFAWGSLPVVKARARERLHYALGAEGIRALDTGEAISVGSASLYSNVTGYVRGAWRRSELQGNVSVPQLNLSAYAPPGPFGQPGIPLPFDRNITGRDGDVTLRLSEKSPLPGYIEVNITELDVEMKITDAHSYQDWELKLRGVYFFHTGQAVLTTTSEKYGGIFTLPHFALSERTFESSRSLLNESISTVVQRQIDRKTESPNPWTSKTDGSQDTILNTPACEVVLYLQQLAPATDSRYPGPLMNILENELRFPTGARIPSAPDLHFSMLAFSPDCGYVLESSGPPDDFAQDGNHLTGPKMEVQFLHSRQHLIAFTFSLALQLFLLMRQMREASTPSTRSRISFYTIAMLALGDGFVTMTFLLVSLFITGLWVNLVGTGFLAFISVSFFGMRLLMDIWHVQAPERERRARAEVDEERRREEAFQAALQRLRDQRVAAGGTQTASTDAPNNTAPLPTTHPQPREPPTSETNTDNLPPPAIAQPPTDTGATPVFFMPSDQDGLEAVGLPTAVNPNDTNAAVQARMPSFASLYTRFYLLLLVALFLSLHATSWPSPVRGVFFTIVGLIYFSFWVPQIHRNVQRNCRHALNWEFVLGQSVLRLVPFAYFYGYEHNVLFADVDYWGLGLLAVWVWIQVVILASQELIGPRWFIRKDWAPPAYDYHPVLREDEEGATMPIGFSQATGDASTPASPLQERNPSAPTARRASVPKESKEKGKRIFDCAICMQELEVPVIEAGASKDASLAVGLLARRTYMVTPCRHIFHSSCLEGWMKYRLQCPICRETLPPL